MNKALLQKSVPFIILGISFLIVILLQHIFDKFIFSEIFLLIEDVILIGSVITGIILYKRVPDKSFDYENFFHLFTGIYIAGTVLKILIDIMMFSIGPFGFSG